jgi:hypothetical protein
MDSTATKPRREAANRGSRAVGADRAQIADVDPGAVVRPRAKELLEGNNQNKCGRCSLFGLMEEPTYGYLWPNSSSRPAS